MSAPDASVWRTGGCHCGAVRFQARLATPLIVQDCNCSICSKLGYLHAIVPQDGLEWLAGRDALAVYRFNTGAAEHLFCPTCGVKSVYRPRSNPDGWSVNARCLDGFAALDLVIEPFDGRDWEAHGPTLAHLSRGPAAVGPRAPLET